MKKKEGLKLIEQYRQEFKDALNDNLNTAVALAVLGKAFKLADKNQEVQKEALELIYEFDEVLGLDLKALAEQQIQEQREQEAMEKVMILRDVLKTIDRSSKK